MNNTLGNYVSKIKKQHRRRNTFISLFLIVAILVSAGVFWQLKKPGVSMTDDGAADNLVDVESESEWISTLPGSLNGVWADDVLRTAKSQLGYEESINNFILDEDGTTRKGYTRYGEWYGNPYGDWNAMFAAFCLHYANIPEERFPVSAGTKSWINALKSKGIFENSDEYTPKPGDIVFFESGYVGIVEEYTLSNSEQIKVIAGDSGGKVQSVTCFTDNNPVAGYGSIENARLLYLAELSKNNGDLSAVIPQNAPLSIPGTLTEILTIDSAQWDLATNSITSVNFNISGVANGWTYTLQYSEDLTSWTDASGGVTANRDTVSFDFDGTPALSGASIDRQFRVYGVNGKNNGYTSSFSFYDIFNKIKSGFTDWLENNYVQNFGGTEEPEDIDSLYEAFSIYYSQPVAYLEKTTQNVTQTVLNLTVEPQGSYIYKWKYKDNNGDWQSLTNQSVTDILLDDTYYDILDGGKLVLCEIYSGEILVAVSNQVEADPRLHLYNSVIDEINSGLNLRQYPIGSNVNADLSIGGHRFNDLFYYDNVANDSRVPFHDAESYKNYLANVYLSNGNSLDAVRAVWKKYLYDMYDPSKDLGNSNGGSGGANNYPEGAGYGDKDFQWPKDLNYPGGTPFHGNDTAIVEDLDFSFLEEGIDYSNFVTGLDKTATTPLAGDSNEERKYDIDIIADVQAKARSPIVLVFQLQTTWQMFDIAHANKLNDNRNDGTNVGTNSINSSIANLYDIKQAMLRFMDYIKVRYPGNNIAMAITDVEHSGTYSMFSGRDSNNNPMYVTNNSDLLRNGLTQWDTFGNCEHVHYESDALEDALENLVSNFSTWKDFYGVPVKYDDINKIGIMIGGPTENSNSTAGYGFSLPWATFRQTGLNAVYGIRTNEGVPSAENTTGIMSWIDYPGNTTGVPFDESVGSAFTKRYVAGTEDKVFNALVDIIDREVNRKSIEVLAEDKYVEDVIISDTVRSEFMWDESADITATVYNKDGTVNSTKVISLSDAVVNEMPDGTVVTTADNGNLKITENLDGTTTVDYNFGTVYNTKKLALHFGVQAKENYIGSNNVFTNVGTPVLDYTHYDVDDEGVKTGESESYVVNCSDTPQVNVPIRFETVDGGRSTLFVGETAELKDLSDIIVEDVEEKAELYGQINGTLTYTWDLPEGGTISAYVTVKDGVVVDVEFPDRSHTFEGNTPGSYEGTLHVTFTPETVDPSNDNFSDAITAVPVNPLEKPGRVWIDVYDAQGKTNIYVKKEWKGNEPHEDSITFRLLADGHPLDDETYTLSQENNWEYKFTDLPVAKEGSNGEPELIEYTVEELPVPDGYFESYDTDTVEEESYAAEITITLSVGRDNINADKKIIIAYIYGGNTYTYTLGANQHERLNRNTTYTFTVNDFPLGEDGEVLSVSDVSLTVDDSAYANAIVSANAVKVISGHISSKKLIITNTPYITLPESGGSGTLHFIISAIALLMFGMCGVVIMHKRKRRLRKNK